MPPVPPEIFITGDEDGRETSIQENDGSFNPESIMMDLSMCVEDIMETLDYKKLRADGSPKSTKPEASKEIQGILLVNQYYQIKNNAISIYIACQ